MALAVRKLLDDASWIDAIEAGLVALAVHPPATGTRTLLAEVARAVGEGAARASASFGQGWVGDEALAVGLHAAAKASSFSEAIEVASNQDGDSDSTASIAAQLYGARHGLSRIAGGGGVSARRARADARVGGRVGEGASDREAVAVSDATSFDGSGHPCTRKIGHKQSLGKGHQEQTFGSTVRRPLSSQTSRALIFA